MTTPVIAVYNMKGGVGKTTVAAHLVEALCRVKKKRALVLDLDPQFNLTQLLLSETAYDAVRKNGKTIARVFDPTKYASIFDVIETPIRAPAASEVRVARGESRDYAYDLVPGSMELVRYGLVKQQEVLGPVAARFARFIGEARNEYDAVFLDCNPSASFLSKCALVSATRVLVPVRPDKYSYIGLEHVGEVLNLIPEVEKAPKFDIVLNQVKATDIPPTESELRKSARYGSDVLVAKIPPSAHLEAQPRRTGFLSEGSGPWIEERRRDLSDVAKEYGGRLGW